MCFLWRRDKSKANTRLVDLKRANKKEVEK
jgi:hypothetical protein